MGLLMRNIQTDGISAQRCFYSVLTRGLFHKTILYQINQAYFSYSDLLSLDLVSESKFIIAQAQSLWRLMLRN